VWYFDVSTDLELKLPLSHFTVPLVRVGHHFFVTLIDKSRQLQANSFVDICLVLLLGRHHLQVNTNVTYTSGSFICTTSLASQNTTA